jgi:hypothetical protein
MINMSLVVTLGLLGALWVVVPVVLAFSTRRTDLAELAPSRLAAKSAPWRPQPDNRVLLRLPTCGGPANDATAGELSSFKDLLA